MSFFYVLENLLFPPALTLWLALLAGLAYHYKKTALGRLSLSVGLLALYVFSLPLTAKQLSDWLEIHPPLDAGDCRHTTQAQAIVVLAYSRDHVGAEFGRPVSSGEEMERLRYAAHLFHCNHLPVVVIGGDALNTGIRQADLMRHSLETYFQVPVAWGDGHSRHTWDNAHYAKRVLQERGIDKILLVTHAWHMRRAVRLFENEGFSVEPAPTRFTDFGPLEQGVYAWLPSAYWLRHNQRLLHEIIGLALIHVV